MSMSCEHLRVCSSAVRALGFGREVVGSNPTTPTSPEDVDITSMMGLRDRGSEPYHGPDTRSFRGGGVHIKVPVKLTNVLA